MDSLLLTDKEIWDVEHEWLFEWGEVPQQYKVDIALAQLKKVKGRLKEFESCMAGLDLEHPEYYSKQEFAVFPIKYWQSLLKEIA